MESVHEKLVSELFDDSKSLSPREIAARNEIAALRKRLEEFDRPMNSKPVASKVKPQKD